MDKEQEKPISGGKVHAPDVTRPTLSGSRFVFTSAQNNTDVHEDFLASLQTFCDHKDAELIVSAFTYNKNGFQNSGKDDEELWYDPAIRDYLTNQDVAVTPWDDLIFCGVLNILPTAVKPLSGLNNYCRNASGIVPHAKVAMESLPRIHGEDPRFLYTTGAVTKRNYIQKKAGQKAEFHHTFGALYVEVNHKTGKWHARQLIADSDTGSFQDLTTVYKPDGIDTDVAVEAINWGDIHSEKTDPQVANVSWEAEDSLLDLLRPKYQFVHDLTDFTSRNHHNISDPYFLAKQEYEKRTVEGDLRSSAKVLRMMERPWSQIVVVDSNHDTALERWLKSGDRHIKTDPKNAVIYHHLNHYVFNCILNCGNFEYNVYREGLKYAGANVDRYKFVSSDESFLICKESGGIECSQHGHYGPNGARGTPNNLKNCGRKMNTGHTHTAGIIEGIFTAGVSADLHMGYNSGPSSWSHSHIVTYPNGKRAIITIKYGEWQ